MSNEVTNRHDENVKLLERLTKVMKEALFENPPRLVDASRKTAEVQVDSEDFLDASTKRGGFSNRASFMTLARRSSSLTFSSCLLVTSLDI